MVSEWCLDGQEELGLVSVWRERAEATFLLALAWSDVNGFPRQLWQQGRAVPGATCASPHPGRWAEGNTSAVLSCLVPQVKLRQGRPFTSGQIFLCVRPSESEQPSHASPPVITRAFNCMLRCSTDIFPLILQQERVDGAPVDFAIFANYF